MKLITEKLKTKLLRNGANPDQDHAPVLKLFNPCGAATWLISEMDPDDNDILFGLCDLGFDWVELGYVSLSELEALRLPFGLKIERDLHFEGTQPMSAYVEEATKVGRINA